MEALAYDDFSGSGAPQSRPTPYNADHTWVRARDTSIYRDLLLAGGLLTYVDVEADPYSSGYWLFSQASGDKLLFSPPFTVVVQFVVSTLTAEDAVMLYTGTSVGTTRYEQRDARVIGSSGSALVRVGYTGVQPSTPPSLTVSGTLSPNTVSAGANSLVMSVNSIGDTSYTVNGSSYGFISGMNVGSPVNVGVVCYGTMTIDSITVYSGFYEYPPLDPPEPPEPPAPAVYWWKNRINVDVEPLE